MKKLTFTMENYLEAIYELQPDQSGVRLTDIAVRLGVTKASANNAMTVLAEKGYIKKEKYQLIYLTPEGLRQAQLISKKHEVICAFLTDVLKVDFAVADTDACAIEHVISSDAVRAMERFMEARQEDG